MPKTILVSFDPKDLPAWAQRHADVVALAESDLAFRCDVHDAKTKQMQRALIAKATRAMSD
ncbi:MAG: hypothetical protein FJ014_19960 [Chloroflexi bacterium]|nr:hypothetical protein [Chloroflexota bacterium]